MRFTQWRLYHKKGILRHREAGDGFHGIAQHAYLRMATPQQCASHSRQAFASADKRTARDGEGRSTSRCCQSRLWVPPRGVLQSQFRTLSCGASGTSRSLLLVSWRAEIPEHLQLQFNRTLHDFIRIRSHEIAPRQLLGCDLGQVSQIPLAG